MNAPKINQPLQKGAAETASASASAPVPTPAPVAAPAPVSAPTPAPAAPADDDQGNTLGKPEQKVEVLNYNRERVPAKWNILPSKGDQIIATATSNGEVFEGTIKEFNAFLKA